MKCGRGYNRLLINITDIKFTIIYLIFLKPAILEDINLLDNLWNVGRFGLTICFLGMLLLKNKNLCSTFYPALIFILVFISTLLHNGVIKIVLGHWIPILGLLAFLELNKKYLGRIINVFWSIGSLLIVLNLILIILFPQGVWKRNNYLPIWLLGQKQDFVACILPTMLFGVLCHKKENRSNIYFLLVLISVCITFHYSKPMGLIVCLVIFGCLIAINNFLKYRLSMRLLININLLFEILAILIAFAYSNFGWLQEFLKTISNVGMDKSQTLNIRFQMWIYSIKMIKENLFLGTGQISQDMWYKTSALEYYHTIIHNLPLDIAMTGGCIALFLFIIWNSKMSTKLSQGWDNRKNRYIGFAIFTLNILCVIECPYQPIIFMIYALPFLIENKRDNL